MLIDQEKPAYKIVESAGGEWRTWLLILAVYSGWYVCLFLYQAVWPVSALLLIFILTLHGSMQHELLHGHPSSSVAINSLLAVPPLALFYPYFHYRECHIVHHNNADLTLPGKDPESYYVSQADWARRGGVSRAYRVFYKTALGRLLCGPVHSIIFLIAELMRDFASVNLRRMLHWSLHFLLLALVLVIVTAYFQVPAWHYLVIAYCATSLGMVRSFFEHRAVEASEQRSVIVEAGGFFRLLFLNNNYHYVHHKFPALPWYRLPAVYRANRESVLEENGGFLVEGYNQWLTGQLFKPVDSPVHPFAVREKPYKR